MKSMLRSRFFWLCVLLLALLCAGGYYWYGIRGHSVPPAAVYKTVEEADVYVRFDMEAYDKIQSNYFADPAQYSLPMLFQKSLEKASGSAQTLPSSDREGTAKMLASAFALATSTEAKKQLALNTVIVALYNLEPAGRDGLLSSGEEKELRQQVANIHPETNLYQNLGVEKGASLDEVEKAYKAKASALKGATSSEAKAELSQAAYAKQVLANKNTKALYDTAHIEPTLFTRVLGKTLYLNLTRISPTSLQEFAIAVDAASTTPGLNSMIIDFRGNIGGALDFTQGLLGLFIGGNQYAFDLYHQGNYQVQRTTQPKFETLSRYKELAILTDKQTQSTAELTTAAFKKFRLAKSVGTVTRGWGTVENTYPLETRIDPATSYSLLLVNSITLRDDNQPVEGRGVDVDVDTGKSNWKTVLQGAFTTPSLREALLQVALGSPLK